MTILEKATIGHPPVFNIKEANDFEMFKIWQRKEEEKENIQ